MTRNQRIRLLRRTLEIWTARGHRWVQGTYGVTNGGMNVSAGHPAAVGYCLDGALQLVMCEHDLSWDEIGKLRRAIVHTLALDDDDPFALEHWNDAPGRTFADVRRAIETAMELVAVSPWL